MDTPDRKEMAERVKAFLTQSAIKGRIQMKVLISPGITFTFDEGDRRNIRRELNEMWGTVKDKGVRFRFVDPSSGVATFKKAVRLGKFDIVFETFTYGRNRLRYFDFLEKDNPQNFLGIDLFETDLIKNLKQTGNRGRIKLIDLVERDHPVSVIGYLPTRDLLTRRFTEASSCPKGTIPDPYATLFTKNKN